MPRRLAASLRDRLEGTKEHGLVLAFGVEPRAPLEAASSDRQHVNRDRTQIPATDFGPKPKHRRVVAQLLPILGRPALDQRLGRT